jgi:hypothetical protein
LPRGGKGPVPSCGRRACGLAASGASLLAPECSYSIDRALQPRQNAVKIASGDGGLAGLPAAPGGIADDTRHPARTRRVAQGVSVEVGQLAEEEDPWWPRLTSRRDATADETGFGDRVVPWLFALKRRVPDHGARGSLLRELAADGQPLNRFVRACGITAFAGNPSSLSGTASPVAGWSVERGSRESAGIMQAQTATVESAHPVKQPR